MKEIQDLSNPAHCPKCGSESAWYEVERNDILLRCRCGMLRVVHTTLEEMSVSHIDSKATAKLPKRGTRLYQTLASLFAIEPAKTDKVTLVMNGHQEEPLEVKDVASQLTVLKYRGLVEVLENHKGKAGGSVWRLTDTARKLLTGRS